jgi:hypothetical protein
MITNLKFSILIRLLKKPIKYHWVLKIISINSSKTKLISKKYLDMLGLIIYLPSFIGILIRLYSLNIYPFVNLDINTYCHMYQITEYHINLH